MDKDKVCQNMSNKNKVQRKNMIASNYKMSGSGISWMLEYRKSKQKQKDRRRYSNFSKKHSLGDDFEFLHSPGRDIRKPIKSCPSLFGMTLLDCKLRDIAVPSIHSRLVASCIVRDKNRTRQLSMMAIKAASDELLATSRRRNNISFKRKMAKAMVGTPWLKPGKLMYRDSDNIITYANEQGDIQCMIYPNPLPSHGNIPSHIPSKEIQLLGDINIKDILKKLQSSFIVQYRVKTIPSIAYKCERRWRTSIAWLRRLKDEQYRLQAARYDAAMVNMAYTRAAFEKINKVIIAHIETKRVSAARNRRLSLKEKFEEESGRNLWDFLHPKSLDEAMKLDVCAKTIQRMYFKSRISKKQQKKDKEASYGRISIKADSPVYFVRKELEIDIHRIESSGPASGIGATPDKENLGELFGNEEGMEGSE